MIILDNATLTSIVISSLQHHYLAAKQILTHVFAPGLSLAHCLDHTEMKYKQRLNIEYIMEEWCINSLVPGRHGFDIKWVQFSPKFPQNTSHSSPFRARYGMYFAGRFKLWFILRLSHCNDPWEIRLWYWISRVQCRYNAFNYLSNPCKIRSIARPSGRGMGCIL